MTAAEAASTPPVAGAGSVVLEHPAPGLVLVRMNRPEQHNALDADLKTRLRDVLTRLAEQREVRAVVLAGAGAAFSVGQDLGELRASLQRDPASAGRTVEEHYNPIVRLITTMAKPVVAAVHGTCVGAGLGFALACDLQVWSRTATLGTAFTKVGLTCDSGVSAALVETVGRARAADLVLRAAPFGVEQAIGWGFAGEVVETDEVEARAVAIATGLAAGPTLALAASKRLLAEAGRRHLEATLAAEAREQSALGVSADHRAAVEAFARRERPVFEGA